MLCQKNSLPFRVKFWDARNGAIKPRIALAVWIATLSSMGFAQENSGDPQVNLASPAAYSRKTIDDFSFQLADGWGLEKIASTDLVKWPIAATWDPSGNLIIAESAGVKQSVQEQLQTLPHRVIRLIDENRDGTFDKRQVVAERLAFPEGVLCVGNDVLVSAPPQIWRLIDSDGDGVCEGREVWHDGNTLTGCANDLHGPFIGPEGWIYWCKAAFAEQSFPIVGPFPAKSTASHLYRKQIAAPKSDRIMTGGMDNLVDITFDDLGDKFFVSTFLHHPGNGLRDGIGHAVYGAVFGKDHAVLRGHPRTGPLMKPLVELGPAAPAGILAVTDHWHDENAPFLRGLTPAVRPSNSTSTLDGSQTTLIAAQFNLQRVSMHRLTRAGASYRSKNSDLLICDQLDFHPVDVLQDVDGSLIVIDTGGWYDLCCPSSGTEERVAPGGIYRLRHISSQINYTDVASQVHRSVREGRWRELLQHPQRRVREFGTERWLDAGFDSSINSVDHSELRWLHDLIDDAKQSTAIRASAFWALAKWIERQGYTERAPGFIVRLLADESHPLCESALHLVSTYRWPEVAPRLRELVRNLSNPMICRLAAECLGRIGDSQSVPSLLEAWALAEHSRASIEQKEPHDRMLEHSILFALLEIVKGEDSDGAASRALVSVMNESASSPSAHFAALHVLGELGKIDRSLAKRLLEYLDSPHTPLARAAEETLATNRDFLIAYLEQLSAQSEKQLEQSKLQITRVLTRAYTDPALVDWVKQRVLVDPPTEGWRIDLFLGLLQQFRNQTLPDTWSDGIAKWLKTDSELPNSILGLLQNIKIPATSQSLLTALQSRLSDENLILSARAIAAMPDGTANIPESLEQALIKEAISPDTQQRQLIWNALSKMELKPSTWNQLKDALPSLAPAEFARAVERLATSRAAKQAENGIGLIKMIEGVPAAKTLGRESLEKWFAGQPDTVKTKLRESMDRLFAPPQEIQAAIDAAITSLPPGDPHRGQDIYRSSKAACSACHRIGYVGGNIGPELTRIGRSRTERDFIESILFPSHRIAQGFASVSILTKDDEIVSGLVAFEDDQRVEVIISADKRVSIAKTSIEKRNTSTTSLMPAGIDKLLTPQELADLLAFLQQSK